MVSRVLAVEINKICNRSIGTLGSDGTGHPNQKTKGREIMGLKKRTLKATFCSGSRTSSSAADGCLTHTTNDDALEWPTQGHEQSIDRRPTKLRTCPMTSSK